MVDWRVEKRNADETLQRAKDIEFVGAYPEAVQNAIVSGELYLKSMLRKKGIFIEQGNPNDKTHDMNRLWTKVRANCGLSPTTIAALDNVFIHRGTGKGTLQYIDRTVPSTSQSIPSHADCADLPTTRYSTDDATPEDYFDSAYALEKISLAETVKRELNPYL